MQQEVLEKKREIISEFMKKGVLIDSEILNEIDDYNKASKVYDFIKTEDPSKLKNKEKLKEVLDGDEEKKIPNSQNKVKIIFSYEDNPKKRDSQDFVDYFNNRYKSLEVLLKQRQELKNTVSIGKILNKKEKENLAIIGIVEEKQITKNGNIMLTVEDPTGRVKVLINKNKPTLFRECKDIVLDEVLGFVGVNGENIVFANDVVWPEVPVAREAKKLDEEKYALFISDIHVGSDNFLPKDFDRFLKWLNGEVGNEKQKEMANKIEYIFIAGDLVDGIGIYPGQEEELDIKDIKEQYEECARLLDQIPKRITLIICPGNHDAMRIAEPQPLFPKQYAGPLYELENAVFVTNPSLVNIGATSDNPGLDVLMYHGYSFDYFIAEVDSVRNNGGYDRADLIMKFLLRRRHLAPTHLSTLYIPDTEKDPLVIDRVPDIFLSGHIHKTAVSSYRGTTLICGSCWQAKTAFQEKVGHNPEPSRVPIINLSTREVKILKFGN